MGYFSWTMPLWEKIIWILLVGYLVLVLVIYWYLGWSNLPFPI